MLFLFCFPVQIRRHSTFSNSSVGRKGNWFEFITAKLIVTQIHRDSNVSNAPASGMHAIYTFIFHFCAPFFYIIFTSFHLAFPWLPLWFHWSVILHYSSRGLCIKNEPGNGRTCRNPEVRGASSLTSLQPLAKRDLPDYCLTT